MSEVFRILRETPIAHLELERYLLATKADLTQIRESNRTALMVAVNSNDLKAVRILLTAANKTSLPP